MKLPSQPGLGNYYVIDNISQLEGLRDYLLSDVVETIWFDLETTSVKWMTAEIICVSFAGQPGEGFVVPILHNPNGDGELDAFWPGQTTQVVDILREIFGSDKDKGGHNVIFDIRMLERDPARPHISAATAFNIKVNGTIIDTELTHHAIAESLPHNMDSCIALYTNMPYYSAEIAPYKKDMAKAPNHIIWPYSAADADALPRIHAPMRAIAEEEHVDWVLDRITTPMIRVCRNIENRGFPIDLEYFERLNAFYEYEIAKAEDELWAAVPHRDEGWNYTHAATLSTVLFTELGIPVSGRKTNGARGCADCDNGVCFKHDQTGKDALADIIKAGCTHPVLPILLRLKRLTKHHSTNLGGGKSGGFRKHIQPDERVHSSMKISRAETGRLASEAPNAQNIPNYVHIHQHGDTCGETKCTGPGCQLNHDHCKAWYDNTFGINTCNAFHDLVRAPEGRGIMNVDWSQLEVWVLAYRILQDTGSRTLLDVLESGVDIHLWMARKMFPEVDPDLDDGAWRKAHPDLRRRAKTANFGIGYGLTVQGFMLREGCTEEEAEEVIKRYKAIVPIDTYFRIIRDALTRYGYVCDEFGRRRHIKHLNILKAMNEKGDYEAAIREGINMPIQSGGSNLHSFTSQMVDMDEVLAARDCLAIMSVHDSLTLEFDWPDNNYAEHTAHLLKDLFTRCAWDMIKPDGTKLNWKVPCEVEWGQTWGTTEYKLNAKGNLEEHETFRESRGGRPTLTAR